MRTGTRFTVSVQILTLVATEQGVGLTSNSLAELMGSNSVMVRQLFGKLRLAGLLKISAGKGPLSLAASPRKITVWDGFVAVEDDVGDLISFRPKLPEAPAGSFKKSWWFTRSRPCSASKRRSKKSRSCGSSRRRSALSAPLSGTFGP